MEPYQTVTLTIAIVMLFGAAWIQRNGKKQVEKKEDQKEEQN